MIDEENVNVQLIKGDLRTYDNIQKITTDRGDDYIAGLYRWI